MRKWDENQQEDPFEEGKRGEVDLHMSNDDTLSLLRSTVLCGQLALTKDEQPILLALPFVFLSGLLYLPWKPSLLRHNIPCEGQNLAFALSDITRMYQGNFSLASVTCYGKMRSIGREEQLRAYRLFDKKYETLAPFDTAKPLMCIACERFVGRIHAETLQGDFEEIMEEENMDVL